MHAITWKEKKSRFKSQDLTFEGESKIKERKKEKIESKTKTKYSLWLGTLNQFPSLPLTVFKYTVI